jgi:hypothetical protein
MISLMNQPKSNTVAFKITGTVTKDDYENVVFPEVKKIADKYDDINMALIIDTELKNFTLGAWMFDAYLGLKHLTKWNRVALIADSEFVEKSTKVLDMAAPGEFKSFSPLEQPAALNWVENG